jgi:hypothetical protein
MALELLQHAPMSLLSNLVRCAVLLVVSAPAAGCLQSQSDVRSAHGDHDETTRIYDVDANQALDLAADVLRSKGAASVTTDASRNCAEASFEANAVAWGTEAAVWVEPLGATRSRVSIVTKRRVSISAATRLTEDGFHEQFADRLARRAPVRLLATTSPSR